MKRFLCFVLLMAVCVSLSGCFLDPAENLYAIPKQPESYYNLQEAIDRVRAEGGTYSPPVAGENQQAVQLTNLDDDPDFEAIVFMKTGADKPLSLCIFDKIDGEYQPITWFNSVGSAFGRVQYVQFDDRPGNEIVVSRQISDSVTQTLSVLTLSDGKMLELANASCSEFITVDLNSDGLRDVLLLHEDVEVQNGIAVYYHWEDGQVVRELEASMSAPVSATKRIIKGKMCERVPAVFVASAYGEDTIVTDIFGLRSGVFMNLNQSGDEAGSVETVREYYVYSTDIDNDGLIELPRLLPMAELEGDEYSKNQFMIQWYNFMLDGTKKNKLLTYHCYSGGWYLEIPEKMLNDLAVTKFIAFGTTRGYRFVDTKTGKDIFSIAALPAETWPVSGEKWQKLTSKGEISYFAELGPGAQEKGLDIEKLRELFHFIHVDWNTGET